MVKLLLQLRKQSHRLMIICYQKHPENLGSSRYDVMIIMYCEDDVYVAPMYENMILEIVPSKTMVSKRRMDVPTAGKTEPLYINRVTFTNYRQNNNLLFHFPQTH